MKKTLKYGKRMALEWASHAAGVLPFKEQVKPIFILGCGRSGTTIFGKTLSQHPQVTYLNEPRHLWAACYRQTDIWSPQAKQRGGKLVLTAADVTESGTKKLNHLFYLETLRSKRPCLIEKLPINSFRLPFIQQMFPGARYVHIVRNGLEVARSIEKLADKQGWFGVNQYKWDQLVAFARQHARLADLPEQCQNNYDKGLLEWRLSSEAVYDFATGLPKQKFYEISYDEFVDKPLETLKGVLAFIGLEESQEVNDFAKSNIARRSKKLEPAALSEKELLLGGKLLEVFAELHEGLAV